MLEQGRTVSEIAAVTGLSSVEIQLAAAHAGDKSKTPS